MSASDQKRDLPIDLTRQQCENAVFVITGANTGIGLETARHLVSLGSAKVILAVRNVQAGEQALRNIEKTTTISGVAEVWQLDLASYASVQKFATRASKELSRLDGVIENACAAVDKWSVAEGHELGMTVNVYSTFLLGVLLFPKLKETAKRFNVLPHLVIVSSSYGFLFQSQVADLQKGGLKGLDKQSSSNMDARYAVTKLIKIFAAIPLAEILDVSRTGVVVNYVCPGIVKSKLTRNMKWKAWFQYAVFQFLVGRSTEMASRVHLHALATGKESHGRYLSHAKDTNDQLPSWITDDAGKDLQRNLWGEIASEIEKVAPGAVEKAS